MMAHGTSSEHHFPSLAISSLSDDEVGAIGLYGRQTSSDNIWTPKMMSSDETVASYRPVLTEWTSLRYGNYGDEIADANDEFKYAVGRRASSAVDLLLSDEFWGQKKSRLSGLGHRVLDKLESLSLLRMFGRKFSDTSDDLLEDSAELPENAESNRLTASSSLPLIYGLDVSATKDRLLSISRQAYHRAEEMLSASGQALHHRAEEALHRAEEMAHNAWEAGWTAVHHSSLPTWLKDNEFILTGHRPPLNSFYACFKSIFSIHSETGNIWTHLIGLVTFIALAVDYFSEPSTEKDWNERAVFFLFFASAISCFGYSFAFHTLICHSENVCHLFCKLDYCGIAMGIAGAQMPWIYFVFHCRYLPQIVYLSLELVLGLLCIAYVFVMFEEFIKCRVIRAGLFLGLGSFGVLPLSHFFLTTGFFHALTVPAFPFGGLMTVLYISGTLIFASRFPEYFWPGKFDIWLSSHQVFHTITMIASFINYLALLQMSKDRFIFGGCLVD